MLRASICKNITLALAIICGGRDSPITIIAYCILECFMG